MDFGGKFFRCWGFMKDLVFRLGWGRVEISFSVYVLNILAIEVIRVRGKG